MRRRRIPLGRDGGSWCKSRQILLSKAQTITTLFYVHPSTARVHVTAASSVHAQSLQSPAIRQVLYQQIPLPCRDTGFTFHRPLTSSPSGSSPSPATAAQPTQLLHISPSTAPSPPRGAHHDANRFLSLLWLAPPSPALSHPKSQPSSR